MVDFNRDNTLPRDIVDEKMDQNEKLAKLRAGVSLAKSEKQGITAIEVEE